MKINQNWFRISFIKKILSQERRFSKAVFFGNFQAICVFTGLEFLIFWCEFLTSRILQKICAKGFPQSEGRRLPSKYSSLWVGYSPLLLLASCGLVSFHWAMNHNNILVKFRVYITKDDVCLISGTESKWWFSTWWGFSTDPWDFRSYRVDLVSQIFPMQWKPLAGNSSIWSLKH